MTASERSYLGFALQGAKGTPETRDAQFKYLLFQQGGVAVNNIVLPLDPEVGGGAMIRSMLKVGANAGGGLQFIPRPETLGLMLYGATGQVTSAANYDDDGVLASHSLDGSTVTTGILQPNTGTVLTVIGSTTANGDIVVSGTVGGSPDTETFALNGTTRVTGAKTFTAITQIVLPTDAGQTASVGYADGSYTHTFVMGTDQFAAPYLTARTAPGNMWGEQFNDCRFNALGLEYRAANFVRGTLGVLGLQAAPATTTSWNASTYVDSGPQFITPLGTIEIPTSTSVKVLRGSLACTMAIPLDEQYIVGSYFPQSLDIVSRAFAMQMLVKVDDSTLYGKLTYDPSGAFTAWAAEILKEANFTFNMKSDQDAAVVKPATATVDQRPYSFSVAGNGQSGDSANVYWSATPINLQPQRQVTMAITGMFAASPNPSYQPVTFTLVNRRASYAYVAP